MCQGIFDKAMSKQKVPPAALHESPSEARPKGPSTELIRAVRTSCPRIAMIAPLKVLLIGLMGVGDCELSEAECLLDNFAREIVVV